MKRNANSRVSYRDRKGKDRPMKSRKSSTISHLKQYRYIKSVVVGS